MAKYSQEETAEFVQSMDLWVGRIAKLLAARTGPNYAATLLMGGFARGWGAFVETPEGPLPCNDIDIALVTSRRLEPDDLARLREAATAVVNPNSGHKLAELSVLDLHVDVLNFTVSDIRNLGPSQFHYDLANASRLVHGQDVCSNAPRITPADLDPGDAFVSICNNSFSVSESLAIPDDDPARRRLNTLIFATKASISAGIAVTIIEGRYSSDPGERLAIIDDIYESTQLGSKAPGFAANVAQATNARSLLSDDRQQLAAHFVRTAKYTMSAAAAHVLSSRFGLPWTTDAALLADQISTIWEAERLSKPKQRVGASLAGAAKSAAKALLGRKPRSTWPAKAKVYSTALPLLAALDIEDDLSFTADDRLTGYAHGALAGAGVPVGEYITGSEGWVETSRAMVSALKRQNWIR